MNLFLSLIVICLCLAGVRGSQLTVCPDDYLLLDDCVTLHQLNQSIESNAAIRFVSATFDLKPDTIIVFQNVSNITLDSASPSERANLFCSGENSGFLLNNAFNVSIRNLNLFHCGVAEKFAASGEDIYPYVAGIVVTVSANIVLDNISFQHGMGGVFAANLYGNFTISNAVFAHMQSTSFTLRHFKNSIDHSSTYGTPILTLLNSEFNSNWCFDKTVYSDACEISLAFHQLKYGVIAHFVEVSAFNNTRIDCASGINIVSTSLHHANHIIFDKYNRHNNTILGTGCREEASDFVYSHDGNETSSVEFIDSQLIGNNYKVLLDASIDSFNVNFNDPVRVLYFSINTSSIISISNSIISNNTGHYKSAMYYKSRKLFRIDRLVISDTVFSNNAIYSSNYYEKGAVVLRSSADATISNCDFVNNTGTGLLLFDMTVWFQGTNSFRENKAYNGGGMAVYGNSWILLGGTNLVFADNLANNVGGGLFVNEYQGVDKIDHCFMEQFAPSNLQFSNNSATVAGSDMYGGDFFVCTTVESKPGWQLLTEVIQPLGNYTVDVTSDPLRVCDCSFDTNHDCVNIAQIISTVETYPGRRFNLSLMAVGTLLNATSLTGVPSPIYASILPQKSNEVSPEVIPLTMLVQQTKRKCSNLTYQINSRNDKEVLVLAISASDASITQELFVSLWQEYSNWHGHIRNVLKHSLVVPAYVEVLLLPCPVGFEMSPKSTCICSSAIKDVVIGCSIDTLLIERKGSYWIAIKSVDNDNSSIYLTHRHCPFDYCRAGTFDFFLEEVDDQCDHNRSGILCGACKPGYSLILGGTQCRKCTNIYLLLLLPFALAGILLIAFLSLTDMTVASGIINGLLFYANIVNENKATFFPPQAAQSFLSVFIAWLNLDFGINSCFYDGMDAYAFTWLQLSFPIYIWLLAIGIIIACRYLGFMNKLCGTNIVQVLATLFLLSYTKLQNTIATSLSFTLVHSSDGDDMIVWLKDGNISYLQGKHIALFLVNFLLLVLFAGYTFSIVFGPCMQRKTEFRVFRWVSKFKPFFDAYFGPLKDRHRHWTGMLLLSRLVLFLVSTVNVLGDDSVNLMSINIVCFLLVILLWQSGSVYKSLAMSILDSFFVLNLAILALITLYNKFGGNQYATIFVSTGSSFAAFCFLLLFLLLKKLKNCLLKRSQHHLSIHDNDLFREEDNSDQEMLDLIDSGR